MTNQNQTQTQPQAAGPVLMTDHAGAVFYAELQDWADRLYVGVYAEAYADAVLHEARGFRHQAEADLLPFLGEACTQDRFFCEFIESQLPAYTEQLVEDWTAAGYPEPEFIEGDIFQQMREGLAAHIADEVAEVLDELAELLADFQERYAEAEARELAEADEEADELEAIGELERRGYKSNRLGMFTVAVTVNDPWAGEIVKFAVFDTATAALNAVLDKEAAAAAD